MGRLALNVMVVLAVMMFCMVDSLLVDGKRYPNDFTIGMKHDTYREHSSGRYVATLLPVTLPPDVKGCDEAEVDLVFVLDASTSVTQPNFELMKDFVKDFLFIADIDSGNVRVGVIIYSTEDRVEFLMNMYSTKVDVFTAIDNISYQYGSTNTADALKTMRTQLFSPANGDRPNVPNVAIVITDGVSNIHSRRTIPEAEEARAEGIHIYAIGIGLTDTAELDGIASRPVDENRFAVQEFSELRALRDKASAVFCPSESDTSRLHQDVNAIKMIHYVCRLSLF